MGLPTFFMNLFGKSQRPTYRVVLGLDDIMLTHPSPPLSTQVSFHTCDIVSATGNNDFSSSFFLMQSIKTTMALKK